MICPDDSIAEHTGPSLPNGRTSLTWMAKCAEFPRDGILIGSLAKYHGSVRRNSIRCETGNSVVDCILESRVF